jgi:hypothetical protein
MINLLLSTEKINDLNTCPLLYYNKHELKQAPSKKANFLEAGELIHEMLAFYYLGLIPNNPKPNLDNILTHGRNYAAKNLLLQAIEVEEVIKDFRLYHNHYSGSETWQIDAVEEPFAKLLYENAQIRIAVTGKVDLRITTNNGRGIPVVVDHKYEATFRQKFDRDNQALCYAWAYDVNDFVYNRIGKQKDVSKKLAREPYFCFSKYQIEDWKAATIETALDLYRYHEREVFPMRYTGCHANGYRCTFYDICNTSPDNREYKLKTTFNKRKEHILMGVNDK